MHDPQTIKEFQSWGKLPPTHTPHGTPEDIRANMQKLRPKSWKLDGNRLTGMTEMGMISQFIPTDYICKGTDENGLPILEKIALPPQ